MFLQKMNQLISTAGEALKNFGRFLAQRKWLVGGLVLVIIVVILIAHKKDTAGDAGSTATVTRTTLVDSVVLSGRTQSASEVNLGFADQGRVTNVSVTEGDQVRAGQVLARLDTSDLEAQLKNARAELVIARSGLATTTTNIEKVTREQNALVSSAYQKLLSNDLVAIPENLAQDATAPIITGNYFGPEGSYLLDVYPSKAESGASFTVNGLETGLRNTLSANTSVPLGTRGLFVSFPDEQSYAGSSWQISIPNKRSISYATYKNAYEVAQATRDRTIADATANAMVSADTSIIQARIAQAEASVESIQSQIKKRMITAPFSGVVSSVGLKPGQSTSSVSGSSTEDGSTITLISENDYEVVLKVPEISIGKVMVGQLVDIRLDAYGPDMIFSGVVASINPAETIVEGVPVYETKIRFSESDDRIRSGMTANAVVVSETRENVLAIPASFIITEKNESFVWVQSSENNENLEKRIITIGMRSSESMIEIVSGLNEGEIVTLK